MAGYELSQFVFNMLSQPRGNTLVSLQTPQKSKLLVAAFESTAETPIPTGSLGAGYYMAES